ncbi:4Fe-4S binding protein [Senegalimassilia faecalis]|uniref:4Fe-4S binding protein n=1 Tax=Senegalimassilia faecalis TaxID=2509433 RepID=UPI003A980D41
MYDSKTRRTSNLSVEQSCIGCGLCAKKCPRSRDRDAAQAPHLGKRPVRHVPRMPASLPHIRHPMRPEHQAPRTIPSSVSPKT